MKKILLPIMSLMLLATGANAQTVNKVATTKTIDSTVSFEKAVKRNGPMKLASNQHLMGYDGSDGSNGVGSIGFYGWDSVEGIYSKFVIDASTLKGYKLVGINFAVNASLGENTAAKVFVYGAEYKLIKNMAKNFKDYEVSISEGNKVYVKWNEVMFDEPYEFTGDEKSVYYGYTYTQVKDENDENAYPIMIGKSEDSDNRENMFVVHGVPGGTQTEEGFYSLYNSRVYVPCIRFIVEDPNGETSVIGIKGSEKAVAQQYYSLDGKQLSAPQKGLNIVKMSDGTTTKVVVK